MHSMICMADHRRIPPDQFKICHHLHIKKQSPDLQDTR